MVACRAKAPADAELANQRAMREARITARLHHRHAVPVFDVVQHEGRPCLIMQFLPSVTLASVLREGGPLEPDEAAKLLTAAEYQAFVGTESS